MIFSTSSILKSSEFSASTVAPSLPVSPSLVLSEIVSKGSDFFVFSSVVPDIVKVASPWALASSTLSFLIMTVFGESPEVDFTTVTPSMGGTVGFCTVTVAPIAAQGATGEDCVTTGNWGFLAASGSSLPPMVVVAVWSLALPRADMICVICGLPHCFRAGSTAGFNTASWALVAEMEKPNNELEGNYHKHV